jgi:hypothetical protein
MDLQYSRKGRRQQFNLVNDNRETAAIIVDHVSHSMGWNTKEFCDSIQLYQVLLSGWRCWQAKPYNVPLHPMCFFMQLFYGRTDIVGKPFCAVTGNEYSPCELPKRPVPFYMAITSGHQGQING